MPQPLAQYLGMDSGLQYQGRIGIAEVVETNDGEASTKRLEECLTFYRFPETHWKHIRTSNVIERALKGLREGLK